jgi:UPF0716 protein FxsA
MTPWVLLGIGVYAVLEWLAASWLAGIIGWGGVLLVVLVLVLVGSAVMRRAGFAAARSLRPVSYDGTSVMPAPTEATLTQAGKDAADAGSLFVAGFLIALPGLVTSLVGLLLLVPPVRRAARGWFGRSVRRRAERAGLVYDARVSTVRHVQGDVVRDDPPASPRGEIISGEVVERPTGPDPEDPSPS